MKPHIEERHRKLKERYAKLHSRGLRSDIIVGQLAEEFFYSPATVHAIIWETSHYHKPKTKKSS